MINNNKMKLNHAYVSLGPTCLSAELLKAAGFRSCTYGFDWFRSGSHHLKDFLELDLEHFLVKHVYSPNIPLMQNDDPNDLINNTAELAPFEPLYGYQYLYCPHRSYKNSSNLEYFGRAFDRLKVFISNPGNFASFLLSDFPHSTYGSFLDETSLISGHLEHLLSLHCKCQFSLTFVRMSSFQPPCCLPLVSRVDLSNISKIYNFSVASFLLDSEYLRRHLYSSVARLSLERA
jgi:hypothetical protein